MLRFLYMSEIAPYPIHGGEKIRASGLIRLLASLGSVQAVINRASQDHLPSEEMLPNVQFHPFDFQAHMKPVMRYFFENHKLIQHLQTVLKANPVDIAVIDYQFYGKYIDFFQSSGIPVIYGTHNAEARLTQQEIQYHSGFKALEKWILHQLQTLHERVYFPRARGFMVVSHLDQQYYERWIDPKKIIKIPNFIYPELYPDTLPTPRFKDPLKIVMTANFSAFQNRDGLRWFYQEVWKPFQLFETFDLLLVGLGSQEALNELQAGESLTKNVAATGAVASVWEALQNAAIAVVPLRYGSGTRLKVLEAMWHQIPLVCTSLGAEGIEVEDEIHLLMADKPDLFAKQLQRLQNHSLRKKLTQQAWKLVSQKYTLKANEPRFLQFTKEQLWNV